MTRVDRGVVSCGLLVLLVLLRFRAALDFGFFWDDFNFMFPLREWSFLSYDHYWRPLWTLFLSLQYTVFGVAPLAFHAVSLALHTANALLAWLLLRRLGASAFVSLAVVSFWVLMGGNAYAAVWVSECNDLLAMCAILLATHVWLSACRRQAAWLFALSCVLWVVSMMAKEVCLLWPLFALLLAAPGGDPSVEKRAWTRASRVVAALLLATALAVYLGLRVYARGGDVVFSQGSAVTSDNQLAGVSWPVLLLGRIAHYTEGLFYQIAPLDLFDSLAGAAFGIILGLGFVFWSVWLLFRQRHTDRARLAPLGLAAGWTVLFSIHAAVVPEARTLYIPTLGTSALAIGVLSIVLGTASARQRRFGGILLAVVLAMHIHLGENVKAKFESRSTPVLASHVALLDRGGDTLAPDVRRYVEHELEFADRQGLRAYRAEARSEWRLLVRRLFNFLLGRRT